MAAMLSAASVPISVEISRTGDLQSCDKCSHLLPEKQPVYHRSVTSPFYLGIVEDKAINTTIGR